jgi:hypothetical protein
MKNKTKLIVLLLAIMLLISTLAGCDNTGNFGDVSDGEQENNTPGDKEVTYPLISYLPHSLTGWDDRWVSVRFSTPAELIAAKEKLLQRGVPIEDKVRVGFDYFGDDYVVKYWFDGILTLESALRAKSANYDELDYDRADLECYLYFNASDKSQIDADTTDIYGPHSSTYPKDMYGYSFARVVAVEDAVIPTDIDTEKLVLEPVIKLGEVDPELYNDVYLYYVSYNGENVIKIYTNNEWSEELWNKVRSTLVFF